MKTLPKLIYLPFTALALVCFALLPSVQAAPDPAPPPVSNTRDGQGSLASITTGINNSAFGTNALNKLTIGSNNAAQGNSAQFSLIDGFNNTALGVLALRLNVHGDANTAVGRDALAASTTDFNTAVGWRAGSNLTGGEGNIYIGAGVQAGLPGELEIIRIGDDTVFDLPYDTYIAGIYLRSAGPSPLPVVCGSDGKLSANASSRRFKHDIKPIDKSEVILALKPVAYHYNNDATNSPDFGLIAEDVAEVAPDLVIRDEEGKPLSVHYQGVNAMLLNEFLKEHKTVQELKSTVAKQEKRIEALTTGLQKVSDQIELRKSAPRTVLNNQ